MSRLSEPLRERCKADVSAGKVGIADFTQSQIAACAENSEIRKI